VRITNTTSNNSTEVVTGIFTNYQVTTNFDGSIIAFVSTRQVFNALENGTKAFTANNPDQNGQIILYNLNTKTYTQVSFALDADSTVQFSVKGFNSNPGLSGNGKVLVFLSGFNYVTTNPDFNPEIFLYNVGDPTNKFTQVTQTSGFASFPRRGREHTRGVYGR
jgi:Tol biopolymer transport system component